MFLFSPFINFNKYFFDLNKNFFQEDLGVDSQTGQSISGHVSVQTSATYRR